MPALDTGGPDNPAPGAFAKYTIRVPNESDTDTETEGPQEPATAAVGGAGDGNGLTIAALVVALVAGGMSAVALVLARRR